MSEDLHRHEEEESTPQEGNESENDFDLESLFEDESDPEAEKAKLLAQINKIEGRNYRSIEDYQKTVKERNKAFSERGREKGKEKSEAPKPSGDFRYAEKLLTIENPEAKHVVEDLRQLSKETGLDPLEAWEKYSWIRKEAKSRAEEAEDKDKNGKKVSKPSSNISGTGVHVELTPEEVAFLRRRGISKEEYIKRQDKK